MLDGSSADTGEGWPGEGCNGTDDKDVLVCNSWVDLLGNRTRANPASAVTTQSGSSRLRSASLKTILPDAAGCESRGPPCSSPPFGETDRFCRRADRLSLPE